MFMPTYQRRARRSIRRAAAAFLTPVLAAGASLVPVTVPVVAVAAAAAGVTAGMAVTAPAAKAASGAPVLVLLQNGETTAPETTVLQSAGYSVTQATPAQWLGMSAAQFEGYAALVIGDPSAGGSCSTLTPTTGTSGSDAIGTTWQQAVNGNIAVLGTAPALPGTSAANTLISAATGHAAAKFSSSSAGTPTSGTGLYLSLNCEYATASPGTSVPLLNGVESIGAAGGLAVQGSLSCGDSGTVNKWAATSAGTFGGLTSAALATGSSWSPGCPVQEAFTRWPAIFTPVAYDAASDATANFTASDGVSGQPYVLLGAPVSTATAALAPSAGGEVLAGTTGGGTSNPAAPGVQQASAGDPVNTENGDFTQSNTDVSLPGPGPSLSFSRGYDAAAALQQAKAGTPGPMGYGWMDNWASSLATTRPVPGDIYAAGGLRTGNGNGGPAPQSAVDLPREVTIDSAGNTYFADTQGNRVQEIPVSTGTQWGIQMTAGDAYTVAGSPAGYLPNGSGLANGTPAAQTRLNHPRGVAVNATGLYIADTNNSRVVEIAATTGTQWGISMTAGDAYTIAGITGSAGTGGDNGPSTSAFLDEPTSLHFGAGAHSGDLYIADAGNNRIQEVPAASAVEWGRSLTAGDMYTITGSSAGTSGDATSGTSAQLALLNNPQGVTIAGSGAMYVADTGNCRVMELAASGGTQWGISMTANDVYNVAGRNGPANCAIGNDNKAATASDLWSPTSVRNPNGNLYIADSGNNRIQEVAGTTHTEFGQSMTANDVYTVAGSSVAAGGASGDGGPATSALLSDPTALWLDSAGDIYLSDTGNNEVREVSTSTAVIADAAGSGYTLLTAGDGGPAVLSSLSNPGAVASDQQGDIFIADTNNDRVQEIAASTHGQFGIAMTAGDVYTVAGSSTGHSGYGGDGGPAVGALLFQPSGVAVDSSGNLYIADAGNALIREVSATSGHISTIAGVPGESGYFGNGVPATSAVLGTPAAVAVDRAGDVFLADSANDLVQEIPAASGTHYGIAMTAGDIYALAGTPEVSGDSGNGGPGTSAQLAGPSGLAVASAGDVYVSDSGNNQVREVPAASGTQYGQAMTAGDIYTVAGSAAGTPGSAGDGGPAPAALLNAPQQLALDTAGDLYIADASNNRDQEVPAASGTQWSQSMTAGDIYTVAGSPAGIQGEQGDGGPAASAEMQMPFGIGTDPAGDLYVLEWGTLWGSSLLQAIPASATPSIPAAPGQVSALSPAPGGITVTQPDGSQVTFYAQVNGACAAPYQAAGQYCALPQFAGAALTNNAGAFTYSPAPGADSYAYSGIGQLTSESDLAGDALTITYHSPAPGSGACPPTASSCETITAASGRSLVLAANAAGLVTSVTDPMGRAWTYAYNSASQLTSATSPMGHKTSYTYGSGASGNPALASDLLTITGPDAQPGGPNAGDATVNVYDTLGRVTSQTDPMGYTTAFSYCANAAVGNCMNPATGTGLVTVTDPDGNQTIYDYQQGTLAAQSQWTKTTSGLTLTSETDSVPDTAAASATNPSGGTLLDTASTDGNGVTTITSYDTAGNQTSATSPGANGTPATTTTAYTASLQLANCDSTAITAGTATCQQDSPPAPVAPGGVITPPSAAPPPGVTYTLYDTDGNTLYTTTGVYEPGSSTAAYKRTTYQLFKNNSVTLSGTTISCTLTPPSPSLPCANVNADGVVTQLAYDPAGDLTSSSTPDGNGSELATTTYAYDGDGEQTSTTAPDGNLPGANAGNYTTVTAYSNDGQKTTVTQAGGSGASVTPRVTQYGYDPDGNQTTVQDARTHTTTRTYNADDQATLVQNPDGNSTLTCYDGAGHVAQTVPAAGVAANGLTPASCPTSYPAGYSTRLAADATVDTFNALGRKTQETSPAPAGQPGYQTTTYAYDGDGDLTTTTAPPTVNGGQNQVTVDAYTPDGQLASQTTGYGTTAATTITYCYDPDGDKTAVTYGDANTGGTAPCEASYPWVIDKSAYPAQAAYQTTYADDSTRELVSTTTPATAAAPSGATTSVTFDPAGNVLTSTDPNNVTTTWTYTPLNLPATITYSGAAAHAVSYGYDASGNRTSMSDATGSSSNVWDPFGELSSATNGAGQAISYGYNPDGQVTSITYPLPGAHSWAATTTVGYGYDNAGVRTSVTDFNSHQITITPNADGLTATASLGATGATINTTYDNADAPSAITLKNSSTTLQSFTYSDSPAGTILSETDTPSSAQSPAAYAYDAQGRVTSGTAGAGPTLNYTFDASSSLTTLPTGASASYDKAGELTSSVLAGTTTGYAYNADGEQLTSVQGTTTQSAATWNGAGQLATYNNAAAAMTAAAYDGNGLRASTTITPAGGSAVTQGYAWNAQAPIPQLLMDGVNAYVYTTGTAPAEQVNLATGAITYLVADLLGSVRGTVSPAGALTATTAYDAWGNPETTGGLTTATPFGYAGGYTDPSGLLYLINRYYSPATGQFLSVDPLVSKTLQSYAYALDDPVLHTDPTGNCPGGGWEGCFIGRAVWFHRTPTAKENKVDHANRWPYLNEVEADPTWFAYGMVWITAATTPWTFVAQNMWLLKSAWGEVTGALGKRAATSTLFSQFACHWWVVLTTQPGRAFHLEVWRPDRGIIGDIRDHCNSL